MKLDSYPVDDLGVLLTLIKQSGLASRIDSCYPRHHLWTKSSPGEMIEMLLTYIVSSSDHRLSYIEGWAEQRIEVLRWFTNNPQLEASELNDDRLGNVLDLASDAEKWDEFQTLQTRELIKVYHLTGAEAANSLATSRLDTTTAQHHSKPGGLIQHGYNASGSPLAQVKISLLMSDKANFPVAMRVVPGNEVDEPQYIPTIEKAFEEGLSKTKNLFVADTKLGTMENMWFIQKSQNSFLCPLPERLFSKKDLEDALDWIENQPQKPQSVMRQGAKEKEEKEIAKVIELPARLIPETEDGQPAWNMRLILVMSIERRESQLKNLDERIVEASKEVQRRFTVSKGRKTLQTSEEAQVAIQKILRTLKVEGLFDVTIGVPENPKNGCSVSLEVNLDAKAKEQRKAGWRVMATNAPAKLLTPEEIVLKYRDEYRIEHKFHLLLNSAMALMPIYLKKENRINGLINILMLALQYMSVWEYTLKQQLAKEDVPYLLNVVPGSPGTKVHRPTTNLVLKAFNGITLICGELEDGSQFAKIKGLTDTHNRILRLLGLDVDIYSHPLCRRE
jgi:transposase